MHRHRTAISVILAALLFLCLATAVAQPLKSTPVGIHINARSAVLMEVATGTMLFEQNADEPIEPASFTKILTLYLVFEGLEEGVIHLEDPVWISERAWRTGGSRMFLDVNTQVPLEDIIKGIAVVSGNDACVAVAEHMYGSVEAFVNAMNQKAKELGMTHSHFFNPHGLPVKGQLTTARDMAILATSYLRRFPQALRFHSMKRFTYNNITQPNRNRLLFKDPTVDGLKTGYVSAAGYHLAATAKRDGMRLLAVVMGAAKPRIREAEAAKLLNYGFRHFAMIEPVTEEHPTTTVTVWKGVEDQCELHPAAAKKFVVPIRQKSSYHVRLQAPKELIAPIQRGQAYGTVEILQGEKVVATVPLVSATGIAQAGFAKRLWHSILRLNTASWTTLGLAILVIALIGLALIYVTRQRGRRARSKRRFKRK